MSAPQVDEARIRALVEKLDSESVVEREEATRELKKLGASAAFELRKAAVGAPPERAAAVNALLKRLEILEPLSPRLLKDLPDECERLVSGDPADWTALFLETETKRIPGTRLPLYAKKDLEALAPTAVRGAGNDLHTITILKSVARRGIRTADAELIKLLEHAERDVRDAAVNALSMTEPVKRRLLELVDHRDENLRRFAIETLGTRGVKEAEPALSKLARHENGETRRFALQALGAIRGQDAVPDLEAALKDPHSTVRVIAIQGLNVLYAREAGPAIEKLLEDPETHVRQEALIALGQLRIKSAAPKVAAMLTGPDRNAAMACLRVLQVKETAPAIAAWVRKEETAPGVGFIALAELDPESVVEPALAALEAKDRYNRGMAATALGIAKTAKAIPELRKLLKDEDAYVRMAAAAALGKVEAREAIPDLVAALEVETEHDRLEVLLALGQLGARDAAGKARALLKIPQPWVRWAAIKYLEAIGEIKPAELETLLGDGALWVRHEAMAVLARREGPAAAAKIRPLIHDLHAEACKGALDSLARIGDWESAPQVERLLGDLEPEVRRAAAGWLAKSGSRAGHAVFVEDAEAPFFTLNALRSPESWKRLLGSPAPATVDGTGPERIARLAGVKIDLNAAKGRMARWLDGTGTWTYLKETSAAQALEQMTRDAPFELILETDRVRIVSRDEAHKFWRAWLEETEPKK